MSGTVFRFSVAFLVGVLALLALSLSLSDYYGDEQQRLAAAGDTRGALEASRRAAWLDPFDTDMLEGQASILQQQEQYERATTALREAIERDPVNYLPYLFLANLQFEKGEGDAAVESYRDVLRLNPKATVASSSMGRILITQGKLEEAKEEYLKLEREDRITFQALYDLGRIEVRTGQAEEGVRDIRAAIRQARSGLEELEGPVKTQREQLLVSMNLAMADALVVAGREGRAREILESSPSEQAPSLIRLLDSGSEAYRDQVVNSELY